MFNIRTGTLVITFAMVFMFTTGWVSAKTEFVSDQVNDTASILDNHIRLVNQTNLDENRSYRYRNGEYFDLPIQDLARYVSLKTTPGPTYRSHFGECFDMPVSAQNSCRIGQPPPIREYRSRHDECFDVPLSEMSYCRRTSLPPIPSDDASLGK